MPDRYRIGVIGSGRIAQTYLAACRARPDMDLVAVADTNADVAHAVAEAFGCRWYLDHRSLLEAEKPEGVIICTPPSTHADISRECLRSGTHVLCEKPVALTVADVRTMLAAARESERTLMMASKFRYVKDVASARAIIQAGILGTVVRFENTFASWLDVSRRWNSDPAVAGGGVLIDNGTHSVDIARYLIGPISSVLAVHGPRIQQIGVEDTSHILFRSEAGVIGTIDLSWSIAKERESYIEVFGTEGMLAIGWSISHYRQNRSSSWVHFGQGYKKQEAVDAQIVNFMGACRGREKALISEEDALASVLVIEAAYASAESGTWKEVVES